VARSITRLRTRGLMARTWASGGFCLTEKGMRVACNG
jgi:hypothetical protein